MRYFIAHINKLQVILRNMKYEINKLYDFSDVNLISELLRVSKLTNENLTQTEFKKYGKVSTDTIKRRFGGWDKALEAANLSNRYSGRTVSEKMKNQIAKNLSNEELIAELINISNKINSESLSQSDFNKNSNISSSSISRRFGSWANGLKKAGLKEVNMAKRYSTKEYFENILNVWTEKGRQPFYKEMNDYPSFITAGAYERKFGKWSNSLIEFAKYINGEDNLDLIEKNDNIKENLEPSKEIIKKDKRDIPLSVRYKVLSRDRFKCVKCGNSPSSDSNCKLHIDHILPWSKGGKTEFENLQTTCMQCNVGKGNRFNE